MSFKCSVFGHRYGDPEVEREREEQGSEVVITITETETCKRCGEQRVVSENKEVTTLETPSDIVGDDLPGETAKADDPEPTQPEPETESVETPEPAPEATDDAEFIGDDEPTAERESTAESKPDDDDPAAWPQEGNEPETDDAVILDEDEGAEDDGRKPGEWPSEDDGDDDDWTPGTGQELKPVEDEQPDVEPTASAVTVPEGEFYCPECEFTTDVEASSLRAGDFCPECHRGSLSHRQTEQ
jgi:ssDNA-binding Zn-finger/Zn-ribbon topoisomerase 1